MDTSHSNSQRIQQLVEQALALPPDQRPRFLEQHCADRELRSAVEAQLSAHDQTGSWQGTPQATGYPDRLPKGEETSILDTGSTERITGSKPPGSDDLTLPHSKASADQNELAADAVGSIGEYDLIEEIARGGMGVVYKARHRILERLVAIKIPHASALYEGEDRFLREAKSAAALRHANVCPIYEVGHTGRHPFIALGYVAGSTLDQWWHAEQPHARQIAETIAKVSHAVHYAHEHDVIHRDLKPSNIMVDHETGEPILMDFGLAKQLSDADSQVTQHGQVVGTPAYMAPEQAAGHLEEVGPLADVYAIGAVLYVLLTGQPPFTGAPGEVIGKVQHEEPLPPHKVNGAVHRDLETICLKALAKSPAGRYESARALAEDLERFSTGEPILARREGLLSRGRRLLVRNSAVASILIVTLLAAVVVGYFASGTQAAHTLSNLTNSINEQLQKSDWTEQRLADMETHLQQLAKLDAEAAENLRAKWHRAYADSIHAQLITQVSLSDNDLQQYRQRFNWLAERAPELVPPLRERFELRLRTWQPVFALSAPYEDYAEQLATADLEIVNGTMRRKVPTKESAELPRPDYSILCSEVCQGNVRLTAQFDESWKGVSEIGLQLHAFGENGYLFRVRVPADYMWQPLPDENFKPHKGRPLFWHVLSRGGMLEVEILRDGRLLRQASLKGNSLFDHDSGTLTMTASREGNQVSFAVGKQPALVFEDMFPYTGSTRQHYGLWWPPGVGVTSLEAMRQPLPVAPSPLERGDELFAAERFNAALSKYQEQAARAAGDSARDQAQFKQALCLMRLDRLEEAAPVLERIATESDRNMRMRASCQLWLLRLQQERYEEGDIIFQNLQSSYDFTQLAMMVPEEDRREILRRIYRSTTGLNLFQFTAEDLTFLVRANNVSQLLSANQGMAQEQMRAFQLCRGYHVTGELQRGATHAQTYIQNNSYPLKGTALGVAMEGSWMLRQQNRHEEALNFIDSLLTNISEPRFEQRKMLLVERARIHAALDNWEQAEADLDQYLMPPFAINEYREFSAACLMRGFLYERHGDQQSAQAIWSRGLFKNWLNERTDLTAKPAAMTGMTAVNALLLGSLSGDMNSQDVANFIGFAAPNVHNDLLSKLVEQYRDTATPAIVNMAASAYGREKIRRMAFQQMSLTEYIRCPLALVFLEITQAGAAEGEWTDVQRELLQELVDRAAEDFRQGNLTKGHVVKLLLAWKGITNIFGWQGVASSLEPSLRGPLAYVMGHRYRKLNRPADAETFFRTAVELAEEGSVLADLAAQELPVEN